MWTRFRPAQGERRRRRFGTHRLLHRARRLTIDQARTEREAALAWGDLAAREAGPYGVEPAGPGTEGDDDAADPSDRQGLPGTSLAEYQPWDELSEASPRHHQCPLWVISRHVATPS